MSIDTTNKFIVAWTEHGIALLNPPRSPISADDALLLAAWLVAIAEGVGPHRFDEVLKAVQNT